MTDHGNRLSLCPPLCPSEFSGSRSGARCLAPSDRSSFLPRTCASRRTRAARSRFSSVVFVLATLAGFIAADAHAAIDVVTLTRTGATTYSLSVSNSSVREDNKHYTLMSYALVSSSTANCAVDSISDSILYASNVESNLLANSTYTRTITGSSVEYLCLAGSYGSTSHFKGPLGPLYYGPTLILNSAGDDNAYVTGDHIEVTAAFDYNVTVDTTNGTPRISLTIGGNTRYANYDRAWGTMGLVFRYTVVAADADAAGVSIPANALSLNSGTIQDSGGTNAVITHAAVAASSRRMVNPDDDGPPVQDTAPAFGDGTSIANLSLVQSKAMTPVVLPAASGGNGTLPYTIMPALPTGLSFDPATRTLSGTPTGTQSAITHTYTVTDAANNTATLTFTLAVEEDTAPAFGADTSIPPLSLTQGQAMTPRVLPAASGGNGTLTYTIMPTLPTGLSFDPATRTLSGTPTGMQSAITYTYTVADTDADTARLTFTIAVQAAAPAAVRPETQAWASRFGRTVGTHITDAVSARLRDTGDTESHLTVAGWRMPLGSRQAQADTTKQALGTTTDQGTRLLTGLASLLGLNGQTGGAQGLTPGGRPNEAPWLNGPSQQQNPGQALTLPDLRQALVGSAFRLNLNQHADGTTPRLTAWGRVAHTRFDGQEDRLALDGNVTTGTLGLDTQGDRWLAGIAVSHSRGDGGYTIPDQANPGDLESTLTSLHPYLRYALTDRLTVWGLLGYGWGELTLTQTDGTAIDTDTDFLMGAVGSRGLLLDPATTGGLQVATRLDAMFTRTSTEAVATMEATDADAHRLRLVLEGSKRYAWDEGRHLTPTVEVGVRHDWGDAETGFGVEVGGRVQYADPTLGLTVEGAVRGLVAHEAEAYDEWGASGTVRLAPGVGGQGLALTLQPAWGATASGVEALWGRQSTAGLAPRANQVATGSLAAEVGYGMALYDTGLVTPYAGTILAEGAGRTYRVGTRLLLPGQGAMGLTMTLEGLRQEPNGRQPLNQGFRLQATWGF